jgi:hypothetical protein
MLSEIMTLRAVLSLAYLATSAYAACSPSETNICMTLDFFASETGYYNLDRGDFEDTSGPSPTITAKIGQTLTWDQSDPSNWYHAVGFAYAPDGAHGDDWGADENPEIEGAGELTYLIDGAVTTCPDAGDTGLDCYEPEFFYPSGVWEEKTYSAELTITPEVAAASKGGVIYYFCHIHSKMSGKIIIKNADGSNYSNGTPELNLYEPVVNDAFDTKCGTSHVSEYADGASNECKIEFFSGKKDTDFEMCLHAIDCQMHYEMYSETGPDEDDKVALFMQQMIPHHVNAVNMAKLLLKQSTQAELDAVEDLEGILKDIINTQNFQIHQFRNYLNPEGKLLHDSPVVPPTALDDDGVVVVDPDDKDDHHDHDSHDEEHDSHDEEHDCSAGTGFFVNALLPLIFSAAAALVTML